MTNEARKDRIAYLILAWFLISQVILGLIGAVTVFKFFTRPAKLISPLPDAENCINLNYKLDNIEYEKDQPTQPVDKSASPASEVPSPSPVIRPEHTAIASFYTTEYCRKYNPSCLTASGVVFNDEDFTAACANSIPLGTYVTLTNGANSVTVLCTDRGSFEKSYGRMFDLTKAAFTKLAPLSKGVVEVGYKINL
jgi:rare lipoprotein A (peptidoglycan hydrolase)